MWEGLGLGLTGLFDHSLCNIKDCFVLKLQINSTFLVIVLRAVWRNRVNQHKRVGEGFKVDVVV